MKKTSVSLRNASFNQICRVRRDNYNQGDFSIMTDGHTTWLSEQKMGEHRKQGIAIPRGVFNRLLQRYLAEQKFIRR